MRLIDADELLERSWRWAINSREAVQQMIEGCPTIDAVPLDGSFLKMSRGDYLIYKRNWLYEHFDMEMEIQRSAMKSMGYEYVGKNTDTVRHGKWESLTFTNASNEEYTMHRCSECGLTIVTGWYHYCPNCGADMRGEKDG